QINAAGLVSQQISRNNDAMLQSMEARRSQETAAWQHQRAENAVASGRTPVDAFSEYLRGVNTYDDPYWGQSQHSNTHDYVWTDGTGSYQYSNDPSFDPNIGASRTWRQMKRRG